MNVNPIFDWLPGIAGRDRLRACGRSTNRRCGRTAVPQLPAVQVYVHVPVDGKVEDEHVYAVLTPKR